MPQWLGGVIVVAVCIGIGWGWQAISDRLHKKAESREGISKALDATESVGSGVVAEGRRRCANRSRRGGLRQSLHQWIRMVAIGRTAPGRVRHLPALAWAPLPPVLGLIAGSNGAAPMGASGRRPADQDRAPVAVPDLDRFTPRGRNPGSGIATSQPGRESSPCARHSFRPGHEPGVRPRNSGCRDARSTSRRRRHRATSPSIR